MLYHMVKSKKSQILNLLKTLNKFSFCYFQIWIKYKACNTILLMMLPFILELFLDSWTKN
jgi:hypothetical protein